MDIRKYLKRQRPNDGQSEDLQSSKKAKDETEQNKAGPLLISPESLIATQVAFCLVKKT